METTLAGTTTTLESATNDGCLYPSFSTYDATSPESIEAWGRRMEGETFMGVCEAALSQGFDNDLYLKESAKRNKGNLGNLVEFYHFGYKPNSSPQPDFPKAGVELKTTPFRRRRDGSAAAKERLVVTLIDFFKILGESFGNSHFWLKAKLMLLVCYEFERQLPKLDYTIRRVRLFSPPKSDLPTIRRDWETIRDKIYQGRAHELHCSDTTYIEACPKGANRKSLRPQPKSPLLAMQRAFAFKSSYMTFILNRDILPDGESYERILPEGESQTVEEFALAKIKAAVGKPLNELFAEYNLSTKAKNRYSMLVFRMLGIRNNRAEEFVKAGVEVKTLRLRADGMPEEDISFPVFKFREIAEEEWDSAEIADTFRETRFFFVAFRKGFDGIYRLAGGKFWAMPYSDLEVEYRKIWQRTKDVVNGGDVWFFDEKGRRRSAFPRKSESPVGHVRPHGRNAADVDTLPNGATFTKQCFWLNRDYVKKQLGLEITRG